jgi:hypothetical protein
MTIKITLICCTVDTKIAINFINSLINNIHEEYEVIIGNSSCSELDFNLINYKIQSKIKIINLPGLSLSAARNKCLELSTLGDIIGFPDDDCIYPSGLLDVLKNNFLYNSDFNNIGLSFNFPGCINNDDSPIVLRNMFGRIISFNFFLYKNRIPSDELRFNECFGIGARYDWGEEAELIGRILDKDSYFNSISGLTIFHPIKDTMSLSRNFRRGRGVGAFVFITSSYINWSTQQKLRLIFGTTIRSLFFLFTFRFKKFLYYFANALGKYIGLLEGMYSILARKRAK